MLAEARQTAGEIRWVEADVSRWQPERAADVIFSNAALHWLDDHAELLPRLMTYLRPGGVRAVQMPRNHSEPSYTAMVEAVASGPWRASLRQLLRMRPVAAPETYATLLLARAGSLDIWETVYLHVLTGDDPVLEWTRGAGLRPLLTALHGDACREFLADYAARVARAYPRRADGLTLFPFRRLFIVATVPAAGEPGQAARDAMEEREER